MKKALRFILVAVILCCFGATVHNAGPEEDSVKIKIKVLADEMQPKEVNMLMVDGKGYLGIDDVATIYNGRVTSGGTKAGEVVLDTGKGKVIFKINSPSVIVNWVKRRMNKNTLLIEDKVWVPLEGVISGNISSVIGKSITWNYNEKTLQVTGKKEESAVTAGTNVNITDVKVYPHTNYTRTAIKLTEKLDYKVNLVNGKKLFIKFNNGSINAAAFNFNVDNDVIRRIRSNQDTTSAVVELELGKDAGEYLIKEINDPHRIIIDVKKIKEEEEGKEPDKTADADSSKNINFIVIDPGHGGKDPGAVGPKGTNEKDVVLDISRRLAKLLKNNLNLRVFLTRTADEFIPLSERTMIANNKNADLFISVHANASLKGNSKGFEVYFLSDNATDAEAQAVANIENSVIGLEQADGRQSTELYKILKSMAVNEFRNDSSECCSFVDKSVTKEGRMEDRGIKQAGFYVLKGAQMPAILVECAFISNTEEEKKLKSEWFRDQIARYIYEGIKKYKEWVEKK